MTKASSFYTFYKKKQICEGLTKQRGLGLAELISEKIAARFVNAALCTLDSPSLMIRMPYPYG